jgi:hypothetical protein
VEADLFSGWQAAADSSRAAELPAGSRFAPLRGEPLDFT